MIIFRRVGGCNEGSAKRSARTHFVVEIDDVSGRQRVPNVDLANVVTSQVTHHKSHVAHRVKNHVT
jgi:hypothetical protein